MAPPPRRPLGSPGLRNEHARLDSRSGNSWSLLSYFGVRGDGDWELVPAREPTISDGSVIDQFGDPDLMADFAEEYLKQFWSVLPVGRLPSSVVEIMPALLLLVTAAELSLKAYWIRSEGEQKTTHSLPDLYRGLDSKYRAEIERRFCGSPVATRLLRLGEDAPSVEGLLRDYASTYSETSGVYVDARYYAEPTTMLKSDHLKGANLVKGNTPYPVFLPDIVRALIDTYRLHSGAERLRRRGGDVRDGIRGSGDHNHGDWGLIPSSLGLAVVVVSQTASKDANYQDLPAFRDFKSLHTTVFTLDWMHGGNTLLFYRAAQNDRRDGIETISGLECRVISEEIVGMHSRDLYLLANELENANSGTDGLGMLPNHE